jgi:diguanylate cyclase (GGDEF)-like protein/PAS domain S-box-containing protein
MSIPLRTLIVASSASDAALLLQTLRDGGYEPLWERVETAAALASALDRQTWELVLFSDAIPRLSALAALKLLQDRGLDLPFLIVADQGNEGSAVFAMQAGAHDYVFKENLVRLVPAIERELREARQRRASFQMRHKPSHYPERLPTGVEDSANLIFILTADGHIRFANSTSKHILGYKASELLGTSLFAYLHANNTQEVRAAFSQTVQQLDVASPLIKFRLRHQNGSWRRLEATISGFRNDTGGAPTLVVNARELADSERRVTPLRSRTLPNVWAEVSSPVVFHDHLQQAILAAQQNNKALTVLFMSLQGLRDISKTFGRQWSEALIQQAGPRLRGVLRKSDTLVRVNSDEFAVLLPSGRDTTAAAMVARRALKALEQPFVIEGHTLHVKAHIGIAVYPEHGIDAPTLMHRADVATDIAARTSNGYALYSAEHNPYSQERLILASQLNEAFKHDQLLLCYQPKADLTSGRIDYVEALVRWQHPQHGLLLPEQFIFLAEQTGLMKSLSFWVLSTALHQCALWQQAGLDLCVAVNLSMQHDLQDPQLPDLVARMLQVSGVAPASLEIEITENPVADNPERVLAALRRFREMGIRIAIDDFGTGYSSLVYLKQLPVDEIKIDKSLVIGMIKDEGSAAIVRATIDLGHDLGLQVAAEGVEDQATWDMLASFGCDLAQGYYLSRPISAPALTQWLQESPWQKSPRPALPLAPLRKLQRRRQAAGGKA